MAEYKEISCKSLINRMKESPFTTKTYSVRLTANPYSGCIHGCAWCYAQYIHKFNVRYDSTVTPKDFSKKIFVKINAAEILEKELAIFKKKSIPLEYCDLSTITDAYQPCESQYRITRKCLNLFLKYNFPVTVLTRSHLILDDIDIWEKLSQKKIGVVGISITRPTTLDPKIKFFLEPSSPSTKKLLHTLKVLNDKGIPTFTFVNPIVPFLTDQKEYLLQLFQEIAETGCKTIFFGVMKLNPLTWNLFKEKLKNYDSYLIQHFEELYIKKGKKDFNGSWQPLIEYTSKLYNMAKTICEKLNIGFSCEGGFYNLWLNDWANIENPYRYPTGFNLWKILKNHENSFVSFYEIKNELTKQFPILSQKYFNSLEKLWINENLFSGFKEIKINKIGTSVKYGFIQK